MSTTGTKEFNPSPFQQAIFDYIADPTKGNLVVEAVAGSGKTTTIIQATKFIPNGQRGLYVAFAKRNVEDLKKRLPGNIEAATLNSLGHRAWCRFIKNFEIELSEDKTHKIIHQVFPGRELTYSVRESLIRNYREVWGDDDNFKKYVNSLDDDMDGAVEDLHRMVALAKGNGLVPNYALAKRKFSSLMEDSRANWLGIIEAQDLDIDRPDVAIELARRVLTCGIEIANQEIDYDDQLFMSVICRVPFPRYPFVFVDEAQDLNKIQHAIVRGCVQEHSGRVIAVGDRRQSLYFFRGSLSNSMDLIKEEFNCEELPLSICYRCGKEIVKLAKTIVPHIEPFEKKHDGNVHDLETYGAKEFGPYDVVICRNTRPLISLSYRLIRAGVSCRVLGKDIQHGLVRLIEKMKASSIEDLSAKLKDHEKSEVEKFKKKKQGHKVARLTERIETIGAFIGEMPPGGGTIKGLVAQINRLFKMDDLAKKDMLVMSTIHKAKGGEWNNVFILDRNLMPSKWAQSKEAKQAESNAEYVAITRAIHNLYFISSEGFIEESAKAA